MIAHFRALTVAAVMLIGAGCGTDEPYETPPVELPEMSWTGPVLEARHGELEPGESLDTMLRDRGLSAADAFAIGREVDRLHPVRSLRAGTPYALHVSEVEDPRAFEVWPEVNSGVLVERTGDEWTGELVERSLEPYLQVLEGVIESSLSDAIVDAGGNAFLVLAVSDILQWDVDFFLDPRPGDRFSLLVETWVDGQDVVSYGDIVAVTYEGRIADAEAYRHRDEDGVQYFHSDGASVRRTLLKSPLNFRRISSHFSHRRMHPILRRYRPHLGVDYAANMGTPVVALGDGTVTPGRHEGRIRQDGHPASQRSTRHPVRAPVEVRKGGEEGGAGEAGRRDRLRGVDGTLHRAAPRLPLSGERQVDQPARARTTGGRSDFGDGEAGVQPGSSTRATGFRGDIVGSGFLSASEVREAYPAFGELEPVRAATAALGTENDRSG